MMQTVIDKLFEKQKHSSGTPRYLIHFLAWCVFSSILPKAVVASNPTSCVSFPCQNGGTCTPGNEGSYSCTCPLGYKGVQCEEVWLTEEAFVKFRNELKTLTEIIHKTASTQLNQNRNMNYLRQSQDQLQNSLHTLNGPRFFTPWSSLQLSKNVVDSSYLQVADKQLLVILTTHSRIHVFELRNQSTFVEIQILIAKQARSLKGFGMPGKDCLAVAQSSQELSNDGRDEPNSAIYCWNATMEHFENFQNLSTKGAFHVEYVSFRSNVFLVFACCRYRGRNSTKLFVYVSDGQRFHLLQRLRVVGAVRSSAVYTENSTFLSVHLVDESAVSRTKIFAWNGTHFHHMQNVSAKAGYVFAAGRCMFIISCGTIYRRDMDSKNFTFHSTLQGSHDLRDLYEYFSTDNEHFLAVSHFKDNARTSLDIYRLNGFDFVPYQNVSIPSGLSSLKVFGLRGNGLVLAVIGGRNIELLEWKHM